MRHLLPGIVDFRKRILPKLGLDVFKTLAKKQQFAESLLIACSDSRMVPNLFVSTNPGELFVVRNIGNIVPPCNHIAHKHFGDTSLGAAIEFSNLELKVKDIIVCGHSECGAMKALLEGPNEAVKQQRPHLISWLEAAQGSLKKFIESKNPTFQCMSPHTGKPIVTVINPELSDVNRLSQANVLEQVEHLTSYSIVKDRITKGELTLHAWWFDIANASVYSFSEKKGRFVIIDESKATELLKRAKLSKYGEVSRIGTDNDREEIKEMLHKKGDVPAWIESIKPDLDKK